MNIKLDIKNILRKRELMSLFLSIPNTIWFNLRYLPLSQALKLPFWVHYSCKYDVKGKITIPPKSSIALIRYGFSIDYAKNHTDRTYLYVKKGALCKFEGAAHIGRGTKIIVHKNAVLEIGDNFTISASSTIKCFKHIKLGMNVLFSWDCLLMDSDGHRIFDKDGKQINQDKEIIFGNNIWMGCGVTILKGVKIPNNCIVGATTLIAKGNFEPNTIIAGYPPSSIKTIHNWDF